MKVLLFSCLLGGACAFSANPELADEGRETRTAGLSLGWANGHMSGKMERRYIGSSVGPRDCLRQTFELMAEGKKCEGAAGSLIYKYSHRYCYCDICTSACTFRPHSHYQTYVFGGLAG